MSDRVNMNDVKQTYTTRMQGCRQDSSQDRDQWQEPVNTIKNLQGPTKCRKEQLLISQEGLHSMVPTVEINKKVTQISTP